MCLFGSDPPEVVEKPPRFPGDKRRLSLRREPSRSSQLVIRHDGLGLREQQQYIIEEPRVRIPQRVQEDLRLPQGGPAPMPQPYYQQPQQIPGGHFVNQQRPQIHHNQPLQVDYPQHNHRHHDDRVVEVGGNFGIHFDHEGRGGGGGGGRIPIPHGARVHGVRGRYYPQTGARYGHESDSSGLSISDDGSYGSDRGILRRASGRDRYRDAPLDLDEFGFPARDSGRDRRRRYHD
jgi:hypothetical protein